MPDHVHLSVEAGPTLSVAEIVSRIKGGSSRVLRQEFTSLRSRLPTLWSRSDHAGSIGAVAESVVCRSIEAQKGVGAVKLVAPIRLLPTPEQAVLLRDIS